MKILFFVKLFFYISLIVSLIGLAYSVDRLIKFNQFYLLYYLSYSLFFLIFLIFLSIIIFFLSEKNRLNIFVSFLTTIITIYSLQIVFYIYNDPDIQLISDSQKQNFEENNIIVEADQFKTHINYFPTAILNTFSKYDKKNKDIFLPLSGISNKKIKMSSEDGRFIFFNSDRYGFNNPDDAYNKKIDLVLIGDSYAEGYSVLQENTIAGHLRKNNFNVISFGKRNSSIFQQYSIFKEYSINIKPNVVVLLYYEGNDFLELKVESNIQIFNEYIENDNFNQNLINRQKFIDKHLLEMEINEKKLIKIYTKDDFSFKHNIFFEFLTLRKIRQLIYRLYKKNSEISDKELLKNYEKGLLKINSKIESWNGKFIFVYLPHNLDLFKFKNFKHNKIGESMRDEIIKIVKNLDIEFIDLKEMMFNKSNDPLEYYPLYTADFNHLNSKGYKKISELIYGKINK